MRAKTDPSRAFAALLCGLLAWVITIAFLVSSRLWLLLPGLVCALAAVNGARRALAVPFPPRAAGLLGGLLGAAWFVALLAVLATGRAGER